jgi:hypothetical protein
MILSKSLVLSFGGGWTGWTGFLVLLLLGPVVFRGLVYRAVRSKFGNLGCVRDAGRTTAGLVGIVSGAAAMSAFCMDSCRHSASACFRRVSRTPFGGRKKRSDGAGTFKISVIGGYTKTCRGNTVGDDSAMQSGDDEAERIPDEGSWVEKVETLNRASPLAFSWC